MKNLTSRMKKYLETHSLFEVYRGWNIRSYNLEAKWFIVDVRVGVESCMTSTIEQAREFIDQKIKEDKTQQEDF